MFPEKNEEKGISKKHAIAAALIIAVGGFAIGFTASQHGLGSRSLMSGDTSVPQSVDLSPVWKAWHTIDDKFVPAAVATSTKVASTTAEADQQRVWGMIEGMAASLNDPYTYFLPPVENQQFSADMSGLFEGVGMEIAVKNQVLTVVSPLKGTPAEKAGLKSGDQLLKIDGVDTHGMDADIAVQKIRGPKGTKVTFSVMREGWAGPEDIKVTRDVINIPTVTTTARKDGVFDIQVLTFTSSAPDLFRNALREFVQSGDKKLILDLRGNPGGYLESAVDMASWFLPSGDVVVTEDYDGHADNIVHRSLGYDVFNKSLKMVILVDKGSASASEIMAGALRYYGVAKMVGTNTFGKGSVQELVDITPETSLKITVARWLGPNGIQIPRDGIVPDVKVDLTDQDAKTGKDPQLDKAVQILLSE